MKYLKLLCGLALMALAVSNLWSMSHWSERRGVADDLCYLRQAHLFQKFGVHGLKTDIVTDIDGYFQRLSTEAGHPEWAKPGSEICHVTMSNGQRVLQYPPGPGLLLAMFTEGAQVVPLHAGSTILILLISTLAIGLARTRDAILAATAFGCVAIYFMINPAKASYSIPPTLVVCALVGYLTARLFESNKQPRQSLLIAVIGLLLGLSVNFRIANLLLLAGYSGFFLIAFITTRDRRTFLQGALFGSASLIGLAPTLIANTLNAGSPFTTTYGGQDVTPPDFTFSIARIYLGDLQGVLILAALAWVTVVLLVPRVRWLLPLAIITMLNLAINLGYFLSHPVFTQYYLMPLAMLSLWGLMFGYVLDDRRRHEDATGAGKATSPATPACASPQRP